MAIADDPSQWTSKPKDMFGDKVKKSLDDRGWGSIDTDTNPARAPSQGEQRDDGSQHTIHDYRSLRSGLDDVRAHCRRKARSSEQAGKKDEAHDYRVLERYVDNLLRKHPMDGGSY